MRIEVIIGGKVKTETDAKKLKALCMVKKFSYINDPDFFLQTIKVDENNKRTYEQSNKNNKILCIQGYIEGELHQEELFDFCLEKKLDYHIYVSANGYNDELPYVESHYHINGEHETKSYYASQDYEPIVKSDFIDERIKSFMGKGKDFFTIDDSRNHKIMDSDKFIEFLNVVGEFVKSINDLVIIPAPIRAIELPEDMDVDSFFAP